MRGLMIKSPYIEQILYENKTWEIRGSGTKIREKIALIRSGSGLIVGTCNLVDSIGPLTIRQFVSGRKKHLSSVLGLSIASPYENTFAWVLEDAKPLSEPIPYNHPRGAIIWVNLAEHPQRALLEST